MPQPLSTLWNERSFKEQNEVRFQMDSLRLRIARRGNDLLLVEQRGQSATNEDTTSTKSESGFRRFAFERPIDAVRLSPQTPDRPLLVRPLNPLILAPNAKVDFFVTFPLDVKLWAIIRGDSILLERMRSEVLSDTWFGDQISGLLAYSLKSRARRERLSEAPESRARAICKIKIFNQSKEQLNCQKFCLRLDHCHLWISGSELWTSPVQIRFNGSEHLSSIDYSDTAPEELKDAHHIMEAEAPPSKGLIRRSFALTGLANRFS